MDVWVAIQSKVKLSFSVKDDPKVPGLLHFTLDPYLIMLSDKQGCIKYHFWHFGMGQPGIESRSPGPLANTKLIRPNGWSLNICFYKCFSWP